MNTNKDFYESSAAVDHFIDSRKLQPPEATIIDLLKHELNNFRMLDIGVGTGRTTIHFSPLVKEYVGIDYSSSMIEACNRQVDQFSGNVTFQVCNANNLECFDDSSFDFVLFSFNGIDYLSHNERIKSLKEIRRITREGGYFCFSTHNMQNITGMPQPPRLTYRPRQLFKDSIKFFRHSLRNYKLRDITSEEYAIIDDGSYNSSLTTYYIKPLQQLKQLEASGFSKIKVFSYSKGKALDDSEELPYSRDPWLYFLCCKATC